MSELMDQFARSNGFKNSAEMFALVSSVDLKTPEKMDAFLKWKNSDGTKLGLIPLLPEMQFNEFLAYIRQHIGDHCTDEYWQMTFSTLKYKSIPGVELELANLAINAIPKDYKDKY